MNFVKQFMMKYMISCKEATRLLSEQQERNLTLAETMGLKVRLMMCKATRLYAKQTEDLHQTFGRCHIQLEKPSQNPENKLSEDACQRIKKVLDQRSN